MASEKESPGNEFKRVLTVAMKTIAEDPELSVAFGNENPSMSGNKAKLPQIGNELKAADIAIVRGLSDSFALRLANHNDKVHSRYQPEGKNARAVFESVLAEVSGGAIGHEVVEIDAFAPARPQPTHRYGGVV